MIKLLQTHKTHQEFFSENNWDFPGGEGRWGSLVEQQKYAKYNSTTCWKKQLTYLKNIDNKYKFVLFSQKKKNLPVSCNMMMMMMILVDL